MNSHRRFEELIAERTKTLDDIRVTIERLGCLIDLIAIQIQLEQQWSEVSLDSELPTSQANQNLGNEPRF